jgi:hypothetical protein
MPDLFNDHGFGPPAPVTGRSTWPRVDHGVSGRTHSTRIARLTLAFASAPRLDRLASLGTCTRRPIMQKVRRHACSPQRGIALRPLVGVRFQVLFTQLVAVLFIVQSPYSSTIGHRGVFSLGRWSARIRTEFHELRATLGILSTGTCCRRIRDCHPLWSAFPGRSAGSGFVTPRGPSTPGRIPVWAVSAFARRY